MSGTVRTVLPGQKGLLTGSTRNKEVGYLCCLGYMSGGQLPNAQIKKKKFHLHVLPGVRGTEAGKSSMGW